MSRPSKLVQSLGYGAILAASASVFPGCAVEAEESIVPRAEVVDRMSQRLSVGVVKSIDGSYVNCRGRSGHWSLRVEPGAELAYSELSVLKNDKECTLSLERLLADQTYEADAPLPLGGDYAERAVAFAPVVGGSRAPTTFFANAKITTEGFSSSFGITFVYSDDVNLTDLKAGSKAATVDGVADGSAVTSPDYTAVLDDLYVVQDGKTIEGAKGQIALKQGSQTGETYVVVRGSIGSSFAEVHAYYTKYREVNERKLEDAIPAEALGLAGQSLPAARTVIIAHQEAGTVAYQVLRIAF